MAKKAAPQAPPPRRARIRISIDQTCDERRGLHEARNDDRPVQEAGFLGF